jgi:hypothetical protein
MSSSERIKPIRFPFPIPTEIAGVRLATLILLLSVLALTGCDHLPTITQREPKWVDRPDAAAHASRFLTAIGIGDTLPTRKAKLLEAEEDARTDLADQLEAYCRPALRDFFQERPDLADPESMLSRSFVEIVCAGSVSGLLRRTEPNDTWYNRYQGAVYVLYRLPVPAVNRVIVQEARKTTSAMEFFPISGPEAAAELDRFLDSRLKRRVAEATRARRAESPKRKQSVPEWLTRERDGDYPPADYMLATGLGPDRSEAENGARQDLFSRLRREVRTLAENLPENHKETSLAENVKAFSPDAFHLEKDDLPPVHVRKYWFDEVTSTFYALGVLNRREALAQCRRLVNERARQSRELFQTARNNHRADNYRTAMREYLLSLRWLRREVRARLLALAISGSDVTPAPGESEDPAATDIRTWLQRLLDEFTIRKTAGDQQWVPPGVGAPDPLAVEVVAGTPAQPVASMPLRFQFAEGTGTLPEKATTDKDGRALVRLENVQSRGSSRALVKCSLAPETIVDAVDLSMLNVPSATFRVILRSARNTRLAIHVAGPSEGAEGLVRDSVIRALVESGFSVIEQTEIPEAVREGELPEDPTGEQIRQAFAPLTEAMRGEVFLLAVYGNMGTRVVEQRETSEGTLYFVHAPVAVQVVDPSLPSDPTMLRVSAVGKEAYAGSRSEAMRRAQAKAARLISERLVRELRLKLGALRGMRLD